MRPPGQVLVNRSVASARAFYAIPIVARTTVSANCRAERQLVGTARSR